MHFGYDRPQIAWTISGTGAAFITDPTDLTNGQPAETTRIRNRSNSPATTDTIVYTGTFDKSIIAKSSALLMPNTLTGLPSGVKFTVAGQLSGSGVALGGNTAAKRTITLPNGATAIHWVFPGALIDTIVITQYNDKGGATFLATNQLFDLGEFWVGAGADFKTAPDEDDDMDGGTTQRQSHNNQKWPLINSLAYRSRTYNLVDMPESVAIGPNALQDDFETVRYKLSTQGTTILIPWYMDDGAGLQSNGQPPTVISTSTINEQRLGRTFILGSPDQPIKMKRNPAGKYQTSTIEFSESPP